MAATSGFAAVLAIASLLCLTIAPTRGALQVGFYKGKCNRTDVEGTVKSIVAARFARDRTIVPALLRLHFHDCFVRGCDASILIDGSGTEKTAPPNLSVRGYDLIDQAKTQLERACPGVVSCADIIAIATRDAVVLGGGTQYTYAVQTGRRDGNISLASDASKNLPGASLNASQAIAAFRAKGLSASYTELIRLGSRTARSSGIACTTTMERASRTRTWIPLLSPCSGRGALRRRRWTTASSLITERRARWTTATTSSSWRREAFSRWIRT
ncbi:peroxidase [Musa troglodytarum]|uniref:peroxidase n=1 Tax=Musa troglodytarum TaxID=320322 RepID=A0A9E7GMF4_9LILI|nr:peroxidase [Musa troglodytarum]